MKKPPTKSLTRIVAIAAISLSMASAGLVLLPSVASAGGVANAGLTLLESSPVTSATGNTYTAELDTWDSGVTPTGTVTITDSNAGSCQATSPEYSTTDGGGGTLFAYTCAISTAESAGETVSASYVGTDYTADVSNPITVGATAAISLTQSGNPVVSEAGNIITETLATTTPVLPTGTVTITDSNSTSCSSSSWVDTGADYYGGENYQASCTLSDPEENGVEINAVYSGIDYFVSLVPHPSLSAPLTPASAFQEPLPQDLTTNTP